MLDDWLALEDLRMYYPGIDPDANSHRRNMMLFRRALKRGKPADPVQDANEFLRELEEELREQADEQAGD